MRHNLPKLPGPIHHIQERPQVVPIIIRIVRREMNRRRDYGRLVPSDRVESENPYDLLGDLVRTISRPILPLT